MLDALPPLPGKLPEPLFALAPPIAVCVRLRVPLVAPSTALWRPTDAPLAGLVLITAAPPIAVPDTVTVPPVAELPKTLDRVAEPPAPLKNPPRASEPPVPPLAVAETVAWPKAIT